MDDLEALAFEPRGDAVDCRLQVAERGDADQRRRGDSRTELPPPPGLGHAGHGLGGVGHRGAGDAVERDIADGREHRDVALGHVPLHRRGRGDRRDHDLGKRQRQRPHDGAGHGRAVGAADAEHAGDAAGSELGAERSRYRPRSSPARLRRGRAPRARPIGSGCLGDRRPATSAKSCACGRSDRSTSHGVTPACAARRKRSAQPRACCRAWRERRPRYRLGTQRPFGSLMLRNRRATSTTDFSIGKRSADEPPT